ncbi:MAG: hydrogen-dependent growth transcriptional repressor [Deltaproteobacteria bacterium]|nr:hydrogen-dependent growth transcriptional repressor [Deltaproteobacteria bacterium]
MGRRAANAKKFIVSCRVNNEEMDLLQSIAKKSDSSISELLRKSLLALRDSDQQDRLHA